MVTNLYLKRYASSRVFITDPPSQGLNLIVTIPCYNEPDLIQSLESLYKCEKPDHAVEVIVVINDGENDKPAIKFQNEKTLREGKHWASSKNCSALSFHFIYISNVPQKHAGVGNARKIAMDEAVRRFERVNNANGVLVCFDADSLCEKNYLTAIEKHFSGNPKTPGCSIYFEHPLKGECDPGIYKAITEYELFLRYYVHGLAYAGLPFAFQTVGSSMAVRSKVYQKQGGMNKRKAGEDFYFLQRIISLGNFTTLKTTTVIPSPRKSDRVLFGTGKAVNDWLLIKTLLTYSPIIFEDLKKLIDCLPDVWHNKELGVITASLPQSINKYLSVLNFHDAIISIKRNAASYSTFTSGFFAWFNALKVLQYVHFASDNFYKKVPIEKAAETWLVNKHNMHVTSAKEALVCFRGLDRDIPLVFSQ